MGEGKRTFEKGLKIACKKNRLVEQNKKIDEKERKNIKIVGMNFRLSENDFDISFNELFYKYRVFTRITISNEENRVIKKLYLFIPQSCLNLMAPNSMQVCYP